MNKQEVTSIIKTEIKKRLNNKGSKSRAELIKIISDSMEAVYKVLWQKRDFWKKDIK